MKPAPFEYHAPASAKETVELLAELGEGAKLIAGGQSLVPVLALRLAVFEHLIDLRNVAGLRGIEDRGDAVWIGAGTTQAAIGRSGLVAAKVPLLTRATPLIGHFQIRNRGTIGGSLAHAEAAAEYPAAALTLDAVIETLSPRGQRSIPAARFFTGIWSTALEPDELLTGVTFTAAAGRSGFAIELDGDGDGAQIRRCAIGLFGLGPTPLRAAAAEAAVTGSHVRDARTDARAGEIGRAAMAGLVSVPSDLHGPAAYRTRVGAALVAAAWRRAVTEALGEAPGGALSEEAAGG